MGCALSSITASLVIGHNHYCDKCDDDDDVDVDDDDGDGVGGNDTSLPLLTQPAHP